MTRPLMDSVAEFTRAMTDRENAAMREALIAIARGRPNMGAPLSGEDARQMARAVLAKIGVSWSWPRRQKRSAA
ncbi:MAG: hypothetical protein KGL39_41455 [Patescibacteria group bacterium]|nr:hypothetical protein [Patescibacteria group bacterium]